MSIPLRVLLPAQPELVMPGLEVVQRVATRHLLETAEPEADESHGGAVTLNRHFGLGSRPRYSPALPVAGPGVSVRRRRLAQPHRGGQFPFPIRLNFRESILVPRYRCRTGEVPSYPTLGRRKTAGSSRAALADAGDSCRDFGAARIVGWATGWPCPITADLCSGLEYLLVMTMLAALNAKLVRAEAMMSGSARVCRPHGGLGDCS